MQEEKKLGLFSYGSGFSSEFYSGVIGENAINAIEEMNILKEIENRYNLSIEEYEKIIDINRELSFGTKDYEVDFDKFNDIFCNKVKGKGLLILNKISNFHREYIWS